MGSSRCRSYGLTDAAPRKIGSTTKNLPSGRARGPVQGRDTVLASEAPRFTAAAPDNRECAKRVSWVSCRNISYLSYTEISRITRLSRLRLPHCRDAPVHQNQ